MAQNQSPSLAGNAARVSHSAASVRVAGGEVRPGGTEMGKVRITAQPCPERAQTQLHGKQRYLLLLTQRRGSLGLGVVKTRVFEVQMSLPLQSPSGWR